MKKGIHPNYHFVEVQLNDGSTYKAAHHLGRTGAESSRSTSIRGTHPRPGLAASSNCSDRGGRLDALQQEVRRFREVGRSGLGVAEGLFQFLEMRFYARCPRAAAEQHLVEPCDAAIEIVAAAEQVLKHRRQLIDTFISAAKTDFA